MRDALCTGREMVRDVLCTGRKGAGREMPCVQGERELVRDALCTGREMVRDALYLTALL